MYFKSPIDYFSPKLYWGVAYLQVEMTCKIEGNGWRMSRGANPGDMEIYVLLATGMLG